MIVFRLETKKILAVSDNAKYIVQAGYDRSVRVLSISSGECIKRIYHADTGILVFALLGKFNL